MISSNLSWSHHASKITSKAYEILGLFCRTFCSTNNVPTKKRLYISLVRSQLLYGSQIWRPLQLKDMKPIESLQCRATKYILNDYTLDYRSRLIKLQLLPLSMLLELNICFFVKSLKLISDNSFDITKYIKFSHNQTRSRSYKKLVQPLVKKNTNNSTLTDYHIYRTHSLQSTLVSLSQQKKINRYLLEFILSQLQYRQQSTYYCKCPCPSCFTHPKSCFTSL